MICNNEALAREGIDTFSSDLSSSHQKGNNEALAREGIDTISFFQCKIHQILSNNEALAREGIDTILSLTPWSKNSIVTMRH